MKAAPILPGESYPNDDGPTYKEVNEQVRGCKKDDSVGNRVYNPRQGWGIG